MAALEEKLEGTQVVLELKKERIKALEKEIEVGQKEADRRMMISDTAK